MGGAFLANGIRNIRLEEFEPLMRLLNRCFGAAPGTFERSYPDIYRPTPEFCASAHVVEVDGEIVSHVGLYPLEIVTHGVSIPMGGIGAVATHPKARGQGHMSELLYRVIDEMRARGYPLSWLGGDRQRYKIFGWERAGMTYELKFTRRSLERAGVAPVPIEAQVPEDAVDVVARWQSLPVCHAHRPNLALQLRKDGLRIWTAERGYAIAHGRTWGSSSIAEVVSATGQEAGMIRAVLEWTDREDTTWELPASDTERIARLMPYASGWRAGNWQMYRIVDLAGLLARMVPVLSRRAGTVRDLDLSIGVEEHDRLDEATLAIRGGKVEVIPGRHAERTVTWSPVEAARILLGGPPTAAEVPAGLAALLPLPVFLPVLDHV
jgi:predicted N-acetyltransferase YhbS